METKFVLWCKNGYTYIADVALMRTTGYNTYDAACQYLKLMMQCQKLVIAGGAEYWGKDWGKEK